MFVIFNVALLNWSSVDEASTTKTIGEEEVRQEIMSARRHVRENVWGNWYGYEGSRRVREFGTDETEALLWRDDPAAYSELKAAQAADVDYFLRRGRNVTTNQTKDAGVRG